MKKNIFSKVLAFLLVGTALTSCLKDDNIDEQQYGMINLNTKQIVDFNSNRATAVLPISTVPATYNIPVYYRAENPSTKDVVVSLQADQATLTAYNAAKGTSFEMLPSSAYTLDPTVTIPAGETVVNLPIKLITAGINVTKSYALPIKMVSAGDATVSGNFGYFILAVSVKNAYDGKYTTTGSVVRGGDPALSGPFPSQEYSLSTLGANSVQMNRVAVWGGANGGNIGGIGPFIFTVDPATNNVTVTDELNAAVVNNPAGVNKWNPATKTMQISVYWGNGPLHRAWEATFVYKGVR